MPLDKIIVILMAAAFFGFLIYVALKGRKEEKGDSRISVPQNYSDEGDFQPRGKGRKSRT